jgi:hypothetical protein
MGDTLALRMALASDKGAKATSSLMPLRTDFLTSLRARLPWFRIGKATFYIPRTILSTKLEEFMLGNLICFSSSYMYSNETSSSRHTTHIKMPKKKIANASNEHSISFKTFDVSFVLTNKSSKVVA